jgi:hypothetical protein
MNYDAKIEMRFQQAIFQLSPAKLEANLLVISYFWVSSCDRENIQMRA